MPLAGLPKQCRLFEALLQDYVHRNLNTLRRRVQKCRVCQKRKALHDLPAFVETRAGVNVRRRVGADPASGQHQESLKKDKQERESKVDAWAVADPPQ